MQTIPFFKYQGTGNDFILLDARQRPEWLSLSQAQIARMCHRNFGIGADGLILIRPATGFDYEMVYFNSDGNRSSMCGNGGRCSVAFAQKLGIIQDKASFVVNGQTYTARIEPNGKVWLDMRPVPKLARFGGDFVLDTGSPHYVQFLDTLQGLQVVENGRAIRYSRTFAQAGINVNFVSLLANNQGIEVATYERGVENETLSCGTGVTAAALATHTFKGLPAPIHIQTKGGELWVNFEGNAQIGFNNICLIGAVEAVFEGVFGG